MARPVEGRWRAVLFDFGRALLEDKYLGDLGDHTSEEVNCAEILASH